MNAHALARALLAGPDVPVAAYASNSGRPVVIGDPEHYDRVYVEHTSGFGFMPVVILESPDAIPEGTLIA